MKPEAVLQKYWGYSSFRLSQRQIIDSILSAQDTLVLLPTGGGKSICYQVPALLLNGITLVISPLISLMKDQVDNLIKRNIPATYLASTLTKEDQAARLAGVKNGQYKLVYVSPEKLHNQEFLLLLHSVTTSLVVVDESHCISLWGGTFRPSYLEIPLFISKLKTRPIIAAFTATASPNTKQEILTNLQLRNPSVFQTSFKRDISISIIKTKSHTEHVLQLLAYLKNKDQPGIIYTSSRKETEKLANTLNRLAHLLNIGPVGYYHAGMTAEQRLLTQQSFIENKLRILVATTAFGMGIDKPDICFVVHYHPPATLEGYFQEIGRAGRSGQHSSAVMLFNPQHLEIQKSFLAANTEPHAKEHLQDVSAFIHTSSCYMQEILSYFGETDSDCEDCGNCVSQTSPLKKVLQESNHLIDGLQHWASSISSTSGLATEMVLSPTVLAYLTILKPRTAADLAVIPGVGKGWLAMWAKHLLSSQWYNTQASSTFRPL